MKAVPATNRPTGDHSDDDLGHETDQPLHLEDVKAAQARRIHRFRVVPLGVLVPVAAPNPLVAS